MHTPQLKYVALETESTPQACVIWLHGLGSSGHEFADFVPELDLRGLPPLRFVFPHAPLMPVTLNNGYVMPSWYDISLLDAPYRENEDDIRQSERVLVELIEHEHARGIPYEKILLAGFSQGCAMALHTGLRLPHRLAGILGLSGYLPLADKLAAEAHPANAATPLLLMHGEFDPVVPIQRAEQGRELLRSLAYPVQWHSYPMEHHMIAAQNRPIENYLRETLASH